MSHSTNLDEVRRSALDLADRSERRWKRAIVIFATVEAVGWISFCLFAWFEASVAVLIGIATLVLYSVVFTWAVALKEHMDHCTQRILKILESPTPGENQNPPRP